MSHLVYKIDGEDSMAYTGELPWHGLGQKLDPETPLDEWQKKAHMDWSVERTPVKYDIQTAYRDGHLVFTMPSRYVLYRSDNMEPLSVVSKKFKIVQPAEVLEFYRDLVEQHGFQMETAGSLDNGRRVWALAKTGKDVRIHGEDEIRGYLLLMTAYDTSLSTTAKFTTVRVVCNNTLEMAVDSTLRNEAGNFMEIKVPHTANFDANKVKFDLGLVNQVWSKMGDNILRMASTKITTEAAIKFFVTLYQKDFVKTGVVDESNMKKVEQMIEAYKSGPGSDFDSAKDTIWGLINAVTYQSDHMHKARTKENRFKHSMLTAGASMKRKAWALAEKMMRDMNHD